MSKNTDIAKVPATNIVIDKKKSWWSSLSEKQRNVIMWSAIGIGATGIAVLGIHFLTKKVKEAKAFHTENQAFGDDKYATWAKQFMLAFEGDLFWGMGTDEAKVRETMLAIPSIEDYEKVEKAYTKLTQGGSLPEDLAEELSTTEYDEMLAIKMQKPKRAKDATGKPIYSPKLWAKRIHSAVNYSTIGMFWGTDEDAIWAVFKEMKTWDAFVETVKAYSKLYPGSNMIKDLDGDMAREEWSPKVPKKRK